MNRSRNLMAAIAAASLGAINRMNPWAPGVQSYVPSAPRRAKPVGSKLARRAEKGVLTGQYRGVYLQGLMRQFARKQHDLMGLPAARRKARPFV